MSSSSAYEFIKNANDAFVLILDISENFPIIGQVASICKTIYEKADTASSNKDNCKKAAKRCRAIQIIIAQCAKDFKRNNGLNDGQTTGLNNLKESLTEMGQLVEKYMNRGTLGRMFKANTFRDEYDSIDKDIDKAISLVQLGLGSEILNQNNKLLEQTKCIMDLDEKMDEVLGQVESNNNLLQNNNNLLKKRNSMDKAKESILDTFDDNEIDAEEIDFNDFNVLLGKGGQGEVFLVQQNRFKRAAKVVSLRGLQEEKRRKLYEGVRKELSTMCRVDRCDNIVRVFGVVRNILDKLVLIMEYASKGSLRDYLDNEKDNPLPKEEVLNLVYDIVNGMKYIYSKNVEHRDLKTDNVLLDTYQANLVAKVCDFNIIPTLI